LFGWEQGLEKKFHEAEGFYVMIIPSTMVGVGADVGGDPLGGIVPLRGN
jgi:hypothetical protein